MQAGEWEYVWVRGDTWEYVGVSGSQWESVKTPVERIGKRGVCNAIAAAATLLVLLWK